MFTLHEINIHTPFLWKRCIKEIRLFKKAIPLLLATLLLYSYQALAQLAPVNPPKGGFRIDGGLKANTPTANEGDWVFGPGGTGDSVLSYAGNPFNAATTGLKRDAYNSAADLIFTSGSKFNDTVGALRWFPSSAPNKNDINNAMYHVSKDASNNQWIMIGGDRLFQSGTSYIDFEFLQNTLVRNANGTFTGGGPAGGRTINDLVISMEYTNGGAVANVFFYKWQSLGGGNFGFVQFTPPSTVAFAMTNANPESVPFGAFGSTTYPAFAFVEAAINITAVLGSIDPCLGLNVKTLWVKTKASNVTTAALKDFVDPIPVSFSFGTAKIGYAGPFCASGKAAVTLTGILGGTFSVNKVGLTINTSTGEIDLGNSQAGTYTVYYTFNSGNGCNKKDSAIVVINPLTTCNISGPDGPLCPRSTGNTYSATGGTKYKWTIIGNGTIVGSDSSSSVTVTAGNDCNKSFTLGLTSSNASGCSSTCSKEVLVKDTIAPVITCPGDKQLLCGAASDTSKTGKATATDNCGGTVAITYTDSATAAACNGLAGIDRKWKAMDACGNFSTCIQHITFIDTIAPVITCPGDKQLTCGDPSDTVHTGKATAVDNCGGTVIITHTDVATAASCAGIPGIDRTWRATDACGNFSTCVQHITYIDTIAPVIKCPGDKQLLCDAASDTAHTGSATATDACGDANVTITYSDVATAVSCAGKAGIDRTWRATDGCGNFSECVQHITFIDTIAPVITCPGDKQLTCGASSDPANTGTATGVDNCGGNVTISHTDVATPASCAGIAGVDRTWRATDACGNFSECVQHITYIDTTAPSITCPAPVTVECDGDVPLPDPTSVTATDNCNGKVTVVFVKDEASGSCPKTIIRTYKATDACGNFSTCQQTITVHDVTPPTIACIPDRKVECGGDTDTTGTGTPVASDNCGTPTLTHKDVTSSVNCYTLITRTWTATDGCGNTTTCVQHITVTDRTAPIVSCPQDKQLNCGESTDPSNTGTATATDNCSSAAELNIFYTDAPAAGSACAGSTNIDRTWTAVDAAGNVGTCVQHITFVQNVTPLVKVNTTAVQKPARVTQQKSIAPANVSQNKKVTPATTNSNGLQVKAYPNPFQKKVNFRITSSVSGKGVLEVYNISGQKLGNAFEGRLDAGVARDVQYTLPVATNSMLVYKLTVGGKSASGKIQSLE